MTQTLELYWSDLTSEAQARVLTFYGLATPEDGNFDGAVVPLAILEREE